MKHKAPCSSRGCSGLRESGPLNIDGGRWWRCWWRWRRCWCRSPSHDDVPDGIPAQPGESPPPSSSSLTSSLDGRRVSALVHGLHGGGGARAPPRLDLSLSLSFCFRASRFYVSPFLKFPEICNSDWAKILTRFSSGYYLSCGERRAQTSLRSGHKPASRRRTSWWRLQDLWALRASPRVDSFSQKS